MLIHNKGKYVRHSNDVMLVPGVNNITPEEWEKFKAPKLAQILIDKGEIVPQEEDKDIADLNAKDAIELIEDTFNVALLEEWKAGEERKTVIEAIEKQIKHIKGEEEGGDA